MIYIWYTFAKYKFAMEEIKEVQTFQVDYRCPKCNNGYLRPSGTVLTSYPPQYPHKCNNPLCDYVETFRDKSYPFTMFKPTNNT
jgi:hypothetical protein